MLIDLFITTFIKILKIDKERYLVFNKFELLLCTSKLYHSQVIDFFLDLTYFLFRNKVIHL